MKTATELKKLYDDNRLNVYYENNKENIDFIESQIEIETKNGKNFYGWPYGLVCDYGMWLDEFRIRHNIKNKDPFDILRLILHKKTAERVIKLYRFEIEHWPPHITYLHYSNTLKDENLKQIMEYLTLRGFNIARKHSESLLDGTYGALAIRW